MCCPSSTPTCGGASATGAAGSATAPCVVKKCVTQITAKLPGTTGVRVPANVRGTDTLTAGSSSDETLAGNAPVILVRGCHDVLLGSVTTPANEPVSWSVKANENTEAAPTLTPTDG